MDLRFVSHDNILFQLDFGFLMILADNKETSRDGCGSQVGVGFNSSNHPYWMNFIELSKPTQKRLMWPSMETTLRIVVWANIYLYGFCLSAITLISLSAAM